MKNIELILSESLKTGKWIDIEYLNKQNETTYFWLSINDIDLKRKIIKATLYNDKKSLETLDTNIYFDGIKSAKLLDFTTYDVNPKLIEKIENNKEDSSWLKYETFNNNILKYYEKCNELDNDPYQKEHILIDGIDRNTLYLNKIFKLNEIQEKQILNYIYHYDKNKIENSKNNLIISILSIEDKNKNYIAIYHELYFNPIKKTLELDIIPRVNQTFLIEGKKHTLTQYIDIDPNEFVNNITNNFNEYFNEYKEIIRNNLHPGEILNELPEIMILSRELAVNLTNTYSIIEEKHNNNNLNRPIKAFFGDNSKRYGKSINPSIVIYDNKVNIDQMRVILNTMKYPITYVQGPPGTGKTQTILNVILSSFFNNNTTLICSSNNRPVDGIIEKLQFNYHNKIVPFPYLRLGNRNLVLEATKKILELYNYNEKMEPDEDKIQRIKDHNNKNNDNLVKNLELYEKRKDLENKLISANKLFQNLKNKNIENKHFYINMINQIKKLMNEYKSMPIIKNEDVINLVISASSNNTFKQYIYFESIKYINKLKLPRYSELINICKDIDEEKRITNFNKWCKIDDNIKLLENVFPVIMTTNISSDRLGTPNHLFDLVIMDEAGQCNVATSILPISRANRLLLVGDTNQLKPVILLEDIINKKLKEEYLIKEDYDYRKSILSIMKLHDNISKDIMLTYHYRCGRKIIDFSNQRFYNSKLNLENIKEDGTLKLIDVKNVNSKIRNSNLEEAEAIINYIKKHNLTDVAIITPFVNQQKLINNLLEKENISNVTCGTIHSVQGGEKETIIISSSISPKTSQRTFDWIKNNSEITNVAVTRAKKNLIVAADKEAIKVLSKDHKDDLSNLINYIEENGDLFIDPNEASTIQIGMSNRSDNEDKFFTTLSHFCSVYNTFEVKRNIKLSTLFKDDPILKESNLEFDIIIYSINENKLIPKIAIELNGGEHYGNYQREKCDVRKMNICKEKGIELIIIPNSFVKSYEYIKTIILESCGIKIEQLELF